MKSKKLTAPPLTAPELSASLRVARRASLRGRIWCGKHGAGFERKSEQMGPLGSAVGRGGQPADGEWLDSDRFVRGERALWRAVLVQALSDAGSESRKYETRLEREKARRWLLAAGPDFVTVCHHAGLEPAYVHRHVRRALAGGCRWRIGPAASSKATNRR